MNEQKNNGRGIFYGVIGVATLVVAIIGATFAYFTATQTAGNDGTITGNMATISFGVSVEKVVDPGKEKGMIPMSNTMVEIAGNNTGNEVCVDDNGNAVCQIYKITVTNTSSAAMFVDGYVALSGGSGVPTDYPAEDGDQYYTDPEKYTINTYVPGQDGAEGTGFVRNATTMRWTQVFKTITEDENKNGTCDESETKCNVEYSTAGTQILGYGTGEDGANSETDFTAIGKALAQDTGADKGKNTTNILDDALDTRGETTINGSKYTSLKANYIRISNHDAAAAAEGATELYGVPSPSFDRTDVTSTLVLSQQLQSAGSKYTIEGAKEEDPDVEVATDKVEYYIMVWLSETGSKQNATAAGEDKQPVNSLATSVNKFFNGVVTFNSAQGSEVTATFSGYASVPSDQL